MEFIISMVFIGLFIYLLPMLIGVAIAIGMFCWLMLQPVIRMFRRSAQ